jgi:hypothetical protein
LEYWITEKFGNHENLIISFSDKIKEIFEKTKKIEKIHQTLSICQRVSTKEKISEIIKKKKSNKNYYKSNKKIHI